MGNFELGVKRQLTNKAIGDSGLFLNTGKNAPNRGSATTALTSLAAVEAINADMAVEHGFTKEDFDAMARGQKVDGSGDKRELIAAGQAVAKTQKRALNR